MRPDRFRTFLTAAAALLAASPALAQPAATSGEPTSPKVQTQVQTLLQDADEYSRHYGVGRDEAMRRLRAQEESVAATDRIADQFRERLAGISIQHVPDYRIVVLLTGSEPVPDQWIFAGGTQVPIVFRTGAAATRDQISEAITRHRSTIRERLPSASGMGLDTGTGELVLLVTAGTVQRHGKSRLKREAEAVAGVPVQIRLVERPDTQASIEGGARVEGTDNGKRYACTTGFVVTDGDRSGIVTAAHCPDSLTYLGSSGDSVPLEFGGQWGWRYQDVQLHVTELAHRPLFFADTKKESVRPVTGWRSRTSTRAGDFVCRRGETSGYSCAAVELLDYAPPGDLCGGPCDPVWTTVAGPTCKPGDSGGPVFSRTLAFGVIKGANYSRSGRCNFYFYMSTDYLPEGWSLLVAPAPARPVQASD